MGGGGGGQQTTKAEPWGPAQNHLRQGLNEANTLYNQGPMEYYPGSTVAGQTGDTRQAQAYLRDYADTAGVSAQNALQANSFLMDPRLLSPDSNPYLRRSANAAIRPVFDNLNERVLPQIGSQAVQQGAYTGVRPQLLRQQAADDAVQTAGDITSGMYSNAYQQGLNTMSRAVALNPQTMAAGQMPGQILDSIGRQNQQYNQSLIDASQERFNFEQAAPWQNLQNYFNTASAAGGMGQTQVSEGPGRNRLMGAIGGGASGAATAAMLGLGASNPVGWGIMGAGALLGAFG